MRAAFAVQQWPRQYNVGWKIPSYFLARSIAKFSGEAISFGVLDDLEASRPGTTRKIFSAFTQIEDDAYMPSVLREKEIMMMTYGQRAKDVGFFYDSWLEKAFDDDGDIDWLANGVGPFYLVWSEDGEKAIEVRTVVSDDVGVIPDYVTITPAFKVVMGWSIRDATLKGPVLGSFPLRDFFHETSKVCELVIQPDSNQLKTIGSAMATLCKSQPEDDRLINFDGDHDAKEFGTKNLKVQRASNLEIARQAA